MNLENIYYVIVIVGAVFATAISTVSTLFFLQKSFRQHIDNLFGSYDKSIKIYIKDLFLNYYEPLDGRLKNHNNRLKILEKR